MTTRYTMTDIEQKIKELTEQLNQMKAAQSTTIKTQDEKKEKGESLSTTNNPIPSTSKDGIKLEIKDLENKDAVKLKELEKDVINKSVKGESNANITEVRSDDEKMISEKKGESGKLNVDIRIANNKDDVKMIQKSTLMSLNREVSSAIEIIKPKVRINTVLKPTLAGYGEQKFPIKFVNEIPRFFDFDFNGATRTVKVDEKSPKYLKATSSKITVGLHEIRIVLKSVGLPISVEYTLNSKSHMLDEAKAKAIGTYGQDASRVNYIFYMIETIFKLAKASEVVIVKPEISTNSGSDTYGGDLVTKERMLKSNFIDQEVFILPAAGYNDPTSYLGKTIELEFKAAHRRMTIGEINKISFGSAKTFSIMAAVTDQFYSACSDRYIRSLISHKRSANYFLDRLRQLTFPSSVIKISDPLVIEIGILPFYNWRECFGWNVLYVLSRDLQEQSFTQLSNLLSSTGLLTLRSTSELSNLPYVRNIKDATLIDIFNVIYDSADEVDVYDAIAADVLTTWIDVRVQEADGLRKSDPVYNIFQVFCVLLWYSIFPAIATDNTPRLMYILFTAMERLDRKGYSEFINKYGFCTLQHHKRAPCIPEHDSYLRGEYDYPILTEQISGKGIFASISKLLTTREGIMMNTRDTKEMGIPRMREIRKYYQPWPFSKIVNLGSSEHTSTDMSFRLNAITDIMIEIIDKYKKSAQHITQKSILPNSQTNIGMLISAFQLITHANFADIGMRYHCEIFRLRELAQNSIYVLDDTFTGDVKVRTKRPTLYGLRPERKNNEVWCGYVSDRYVKNIAFELPLTMFYCLLGLNNNVVIKAPNVEVQNRNLEIIQRQGRDFGDLIGYINAVKFGGFPGFEDELQFIGNYLRQTAVIEMLKNLGKVISSDYSQVFSTSVGAVTTTLDGRAKAFKIGLGTYKCPNEIPHGEIDTEYNKTLEIMSVYLYETCNELSRLFVPEKSPIRLYHRGLLIWRKYVPELNPNSSIDLSEWYDNLKPRILVWSTTFISKRMEDAVSCKIITELVLPIGEDSEDIRFSYGASMPNILFIIGTNTGPLSSKDFAFLYNFFENGQVSFLLPDLIVLLDCEWNQGVSKDRDLEDQLVDLLTGGVDRRMILKVYDTTVHEISPDSTTNRLKYFHLIQPPRDHDIVLRNINTDFQKDSHFLMSPWTMWAFGSNDGRYLDVTEDEMIALQGRHLIANVPIDPNLGGALVNKLELGTINLNNAVKVLVNPICQQLPTIEQNDDNVVMLDFVNNPPV